MRLEKKKSEDFCKEWTEYEQGVEFKQRINLYSKVKEAYNYVQGNQWDGVESNGLPTPVFNIIKPVLNYKIASIMQYRASILYTSTAGNKDEFKEYTQVADKLTEYANQLKENMKLDYLDENLLRDSAIAGSGIMHFYYDDEEKEVKCEQIDVTNIYPSNPNNSSIQEQRYIIIAFRRPVADVRDEALSNGINDIDGITSDNENQYEASDNAEVEIDDKEGQCVVLLKYWKDSKTKTIHFKKCVRGMTIQEDTDTGLTYYPISMMTWEPNKNCFFGISDVEALIPNQDYINTIASMIMSSTSFSAFPKMIFDETALGGKAPDTTVGMAIGVNAPSENVRNYIDYISPPGISRDAFDMFDKTINLTKDLMGANDGALGNINPEQASGRAITAIVEQSAIPLENIKKRYYNYLEDVATIWADFWRANVDENEPKVINITTENGGIEAYEISKEAFDTIMLKTRIEVGPASKWTEIALIQTLDNLLQANLIPFELYVELIPEGSAFPKKKVKEWFKKQQEAQDQQMMLKQQAMAEQQAMENEAMAIQQQQAVAEVQGQKAVEDVLNAIPPELQETIMNNPQVLEAMIQKQAMKQQG